MIVVYGRQSVDKKDSISIETQIENCKAHILLSDPDAINDIVVYQDKGYSGSNINRPDFEKLLNDVKNNLVSKVVVYKLDRISRSLLDFSQIIDLFKKYNTDFVSTQEKFDTSTPMGNAMLSITMVFAQLERETIQMRIKDNYYARGKHGMYLGGRAPFGFHKVDTILNGKKTYTFEPSNESSDVLKRIYISYIENGVSLGKVAQELNDENVLAPSGGAWDSCKLSRIMRNPVYVKADADIYIYYKNKGCIMSNEISDFIGVNGCYLYGKRQTNERKYTNVEDHTVSLALHEGLISSNVFLKCQYKLDSNRQIKRSGASQVSWLSGLTKCGFCGYAMTIIHCYKDIYTFNCSGRKNHISCDRKILSFRVYDIEDYVEKQIFNYVHEHETILIKKPIKEKTDNNIKIQIIQIEQKINNLFEQIANGNEVVNKYLNEKISQLDYEKQQLITQQSRNKVLQVSNKEKKELIELVYQWKTISFEEKKTVAKAFIEKIIFNDETMEIVWKKNF